MLQVTVGMLKRLHHGLAHIPHVRLSTTAINQSCFLPCRPTALECPAKPDLPRWRISCTAMEVLPTPPILCADVVAVVAPREKPTSDVALDAMPSTHSLSSASSSCRACTSGGIVAYFKAYFKADCWSPDCKMPAAIDTLLARVGDDLIWLLVLLVEPSVLLVELLALIDPRFVQLALDLCAIKIILCPWGQRRAPAGAGQSLWHRTRACAQIPS